MSVNSLSHRTISGSLAYDLTDHLPNFIIVNKFTALPKNVFKVIRDYSNFDPSKLCNDVRSINWENILILMTHMRYLILFTQN